ncbi:histone-lysine N-methyltransferase SETMAR [Trichonephila clavipes]|nr:histone-lysine N-methyltransferase SETMAR [Trichonephila clavipes]
MIVVSISREVSIKQFQIYARCQGGDISHQKNYLAVCCFVNSVVSYKMLKMEVNKEKIRYILQFFLHNCENAGQMAEIVNRVYGADTLTANYVQFYFHSSIFDVKVAPRTGSSRSITQELKIDHKIVLSHLSKVGIKKKLDVWVPHQLTPKNMMDQISVREALAKRNEIDGFLKRMVTGDEKWVTYANTGRKRSW